MNKSVRFLVLQALVAALYTALTLALQPIAFGPLQCRVSEALTVLPFVAPGFTVGLTAGCLLSNLLGGSVLLDIIVGPLATCLAGWLTSRMPSRWLAPLPPVVVNALAVGAVLSYSTAPGAFWSAFPLIAAQVGLGQVGACYVLGLPLLALLQRTGLQERLRA